MKLFEIKTRSTQLSSFCDYENTGLVTTIFNHYYTHLELKFQHLFSTFRERNFLNQQLCKILKDNWKMIKGTGLSYTAVPDDEITKIMIGISIYLSEQANYLETHPLQLLMPGVNFESIHDDFPTLTTQDNKKTKQITQILETHILAENSLYLIPIGLLTKLDISPVQAKMINPYYHFEQHEEDCGYLKTSEITRLFEHSKLTKKILDKKTAYETLANSENHLLGRIRKLCQSLKLSSRYEDGSEMEAGQTAYQGMVEFVDYYNQLFGKSIHTGNKLPEDLSQFNHSYMFIKKSNLFLIEDNQAHPISLTNKSQFKKTLRKIRDQQSNETPTLKLTVLELNELIEQNSQHETIDSRISSTLKKKILELIKFTSNPKENYDATQDTRNCVVTLRESLIIDLNGQEDTLMQFGTETDEKIDLNPSVLELNQAMQILKAKLMSNTYNTGFDELESYAVLLEPLDVDFEINTIHELDFLETLSHETIQGIFNYTAFRQQAVSQFSTINDLVSFLIDLPLKTVECFIKCIKKELHSYLIHTAGNLNELVRVMDAEYCAIVIKELGPLCITTVDDFIELQQDMDIQPFQRSCQQLKSLLEELLTINDFIRAEQAFQHPDKSLFWKTLLLPNLINLIDHFDDWLTLKPYLETIESSELFTHRIKEWVVQIHDWAEFQRLNHVLNPEQRELYFQVIDSQIHLIISNCHQLTAFMQMLTPIYKQKFIVDHHELIVMYAENNQQFSAILLLLTTQQQLCLNDLIQPHIFSVVIQSIGDDWMDAGDKINFYASLRPVFQSLKQLCGTQKAYTFMDTLAHKNERDINLCFSELFVEKSSHRFFSNRAQTNSILNELIKLPGPAKHLLFSSLDIQLNHQSQSQQFNLLGLKYDEIYQSQPHAKKYKAHVPV